MGMGTGRKRYEGRRNEMGLGGKLRWDGRIGIRRKDWDGKARLVWEEKIGMGREDWIGEGRLGWG
jgi:hypothetical protein